MKARSIYSLLCNRPKTSSRRTTPSTSSEGLYTPAACSGADSPGAPVGRLATPGRVLHCSSCFYRFKATFCLKDALTRPNYRDILTLLCRSPTGLMRVMWTALGGEMRMAGLIYITKSECAPSLTLIRRGHPDTTINLHRLH
jgi:hypothetical protein